jgi:hypothetical protein
MTFVSSVIRGCAAAHTLGALYRAFARKLSV